jgi:hypothetical protein
VYLQKTISSLPLHFSSISKGCGQNKSNIREMRSLLMVSLFDMSGNVDVTRKGKF